MECLDQHPVKSWVDPGRPELANSLIGIEAWHLEDVGSDQLDHERQGLDHRAGECEWVVAQSGAESEERPRPR